MNNKNIISFSGGKDSTALILWAKENLNDYEVVFCDTGWEHPMTYEYIAYINKVLLSEKLIIIKSNKYNSFLDLSIKKKRFPSIMARFCTEELKIKPIKNYIQKYLPNVNIYVGVRADESRSRAFLSERAYADVYKCDMVRPLLKYSAQDCFDLLKKHGIKPNPLYKFGMKRVGCMPCIMVSKGELKNIIRKFPNVIENLKSAENEVKRTFFPPKYIPDRFCSKIVSPSKKIPTCEDVIRYVSEDENQLRLIEDSETCMSYYAICE